MHTQTNKNKQPQNLSALRRKFVSENTDIAIVLNWYEKEGKNLIDEEPIQNLTVNDVLTLFDAPFWNKVYHCWALNNKQINRIQANVSHKIDPTKYAYFVEIYKKQNPNGQQA